MRQILTTFVLTIMVDPGRPAAANPSEFMAAILVIALSSASLLAQILSAWGSSPMGEALSGLPLRVKRRRAAIGRSTSMEKSEKMKPMRDTLEKLAILALFLAVIFIYARPAIVRLVALAGQAVPQGRPPRGS